MDFSGEYGNLIALHKIEIIGITYWFRIFPYSVRMRENIDQNKSEYGHFLRSNYCVLRKSNLEGLGVNEKMLTNLVS